MTFLREFQSPPPVIRSEGLPAAADPPDRSSQTLLILAVLLLLCLVPRALMAWQLGAVCDDGYYYISVADALEHRDFDTAFYYLHVNVYPAILLIGQRLGLDWIVAGKLWGVLIGSLTILPLFGWVRRLFDLRTAAAAGFLYAVHPDLIELSVEPLREQTFWFLFTFCLYMMGRAISERKFRWFLGTGLALALAIHTRIEGWILLLPLIAWTANRWRLARIGRLKLVSGTLLALAVTPCLLVSVNLTLLRDYSRWEWGRLRPFRLCLNYSRECLRAISPGGDEEPSDVVRSATAASSGSKAALKGRSDKPSSASTGSATTPDVTSGRPSPLWGFVYEWGRTRQPVNLVLLLIGLIGGRRLLRDPDKLVLVVISMAIAVGIWISLMTRGDLNAGRYFLTNFLVLVPFTAVGFQFAITRLFQWGERWKQSRRLLVSPAVGFVLLLTIVYWGDALSSRHVTREQQANIGRRLQSEFGPFSSVVTDDRSGRMGYFAQGDMPVTPCRLRKLGPLIRKTTPDLVILRKPIFPDAPQNDVVKEITRLGLHRVPPGELFPETGQFDVYTRRLPRTFVEEPQAPGNIATRPGTRRH